TRTVRVCNASRSTSGAGKGMNTDVVGKKPAKYSAALKGIVWHGRFEGRIAAEIGENCPQTTGRKAPCSHIAVLPRIFDGVGGRRAEPFVPDLAGSVHFGFAQGICRSEERV